ncbi:MAG TPA: hypothetical protein VFB78_03275 [Acidimicrobiales bacterium]|nr:hypothetical protein [Acidimicrobiales bacterium]
MIGALVIVFMCVIALPMAFMFTGAAIASVFGFSLKSHAEATHEGSELIDTNY